MDARSLEAAVARKASAAVPVDASVRQKAAAAAPPAASGVSPDAEPQQGPVAALLHKLQTHKEAAAAAPHDAQEQQDEGSPLTEILQRMRRRRAAHEAGGAAEEEQRPSEVQDEGSRLAAMLQRMRRRRAAHEVGQVPIVKLYGGVQQHQQPVDARGRLGAVLGAVSLLAMASLLVARRIRSY